jgi:hypothetical protein
MVGIATTVAGSLYEVRLHRPRVIAAATVARSFAADFLQVQQTHLQRFNLWWPPEGVAR